MFLTSNWRGCYNKVIKAFVPAPTRKIYPQTSDGLYVSYTLKDSPFYLLHSHTYDKTRLSERGRTFFLPHGSRSNPSWKQGQRLKFPLHLEGPFTIEVNWPGLSGARFLQSCIHQRCVSRSSTRVVTDEEERGKGGASNLNDESREVWKPLARRDTRWPMTPSTQTWEEFDY